MFKLVFLIFISTCQLAYAWRLPPTYEPSKKFKEYMKSTSQESRKYHDCLKQTQFEDCEIALCLGSTLMNRSENYLDALKKYEKSCKDEQIKNALSSTIGFWYESTIDVGWDNEGPSVPAIENFKFDGVKDQSDRNNVTKKRNLAFQDFRKQISEFNKGNIKLPDYKPRKEFLEYLKQNPYSTRSYRQCSDQVTLNGCEKKLCFIITKMNKGFSYYKLRNFAGGCPGSMSEMLFKKYNLWLFSDGAHPEDWDSEGMPDHVLRTKKDLASGAILYLPFTR